MTISRSFKILNYKALDNLNVNYRTDMNSNLNDLLNDNTQLITGLSNIFDLTFTFSEVTAPKNLDKYVAIEVTTMAKTIILFGSIFVPQ